MTPGYIVLASSSPRRADLLRQARIPFRVHPPDVDETAEPGESEDHYVTRLARMKARAVCAPVPVLAADTVVTIDGQLLGKPRDKQHFIAMMRALSGREHRVLTAIALRWGAREAIRTAGATVTLRGLTPAEIDAYWATGEPQDKAGGYGIQGIGGTFVRTVHGSYHAVVGLPLAETEELLAAFGIDTWRWRDG